MPDRQRGTAQPAAKKLFNSVFIPHGEKKTVK